ncbi:competence/damage-inducible protein A [Galbibacter sp.]|uniref:competence/damage-inducible protein A n=1 Tax=Galbibacter sp. TaxID=2918471 RepID=UPI003A92A27C
MLAEIITIGDEILIGQVVDTNSAFIAKRLNSIGISVFQMSSVQDERNHILKAMEEAESRVDIVIITGGLGPTKDDITKHTICTYFEDKLVENKAVLQNIERLFKNYSNSPISDLNKWQALVPSKAEVLMNQFGTAPGMWLEKNGKVFISLPGVPFEMEALIVDSILPKLQKQFKHPYIIHKTILTYGLGESALAERLEYWEDHLPASIKLAYLPNLGKVRLRLTAKGDDKQVLEREIQEQMEGLMPLIQDLYFGLEEENALEVTLAKLLTGSKQSLSVAESCTGGKLAEIFTAIPGASAFFNGGVVSYATQAKVDVLNIEESLIKAHSVVSAAVAEAMALSAKKLFKTDFALSTTGNAGPLKGDSDAEIGTVFIALATPNGVFSQQFNLGNHRDKVVNKAVNKALEMLFKEFSKK